MALLHSRRTSIPLNKIFKEEARNQIPSLLRQKLLLINPGRNQTSYVQRQFFLRIKAKLLLWNHPRRNNFSAKGCPQLVVGRFRKKPRLTLALTRIQYRFLNKIVVICDVRKELTVFKQLTNLSLDNLKTKSKLVTVTQ